MSIWFGNPTVAEINRYQTDMVKHVGIEFTEIGEDYICATMPVDDRTKQPMGLLHGGASCVLAESLGSTAGSLCVDHSKSYVVGIEINASHLRSATSGVVTGTARPVRIGRSNQVWDIQIKNGQNKLVCVSRLTLAVIGATANRS